MNLFQRYGIKEVADVVFYSITTIGDEEIYTPVLFLDTLKVSTVEKTAEKVSAQGGKGNKKLITWNYGKEMTLTLQDALFSPASMSLIWGGKLESKLSDYTSAIVKLNIANKYGRLHYSTKAYPSPALTEDEWEIVFKAATEVKLLGEDEDEGADSNDKKFWTPTYRITKDEEKIEQNRTLLRKNYFTRGWLLNKDKEVFRPTFEQIFGDLTDEEQVAQQAMPQVVIVKILDYINELKKIGTIETQIQDTEFVDRFERCIVTDREGFKISTSQQKKNLLRYYQGDHTSSYIIYYDPKTMLPLLNISPDGAICGWDAGEEPPHDRDFNGEADNDIFTIKFGTSYLKWERTVKYKDGADDGILGKTFIIDADTFPDAYKIVGETYIRNQKTGKDERCQIIIHRAAVSSDTSITLEAEGEPTVFDLTIDVLTPKNDIPIEIKTFDVDEDVMHGGNRVVPRKSTYTYTPALQEIKKNIGLENPEIY